MTFLSVFVYVQIKMFSTFNAPWLNQLNLGWCTVLSLVASAVMFANSLPWHTHTKKWTKQPIVFFYCHCAWTLTLQVTQGVSCSELMNTLTCQWCALVTLSAGFVSVDGFNNKLLADPAPMLITKVMRDEMLVSKNGQHPGGRHLLFLFFFFFFFYPIIAHN